MEIGNLSSTTLSERLHPSFKLLFDFVKNKDFNELPSGKVEIDGDNVFVMNLNIPGADENKQPLEMHRKYIDVHILLGGTEKSAGNPSMKLNTILREYDETATAPSAMILPVSLCNYIRANIA